MDPTPLTAAQRVAQLIERLDVTPYQFGKATGLSHQTISNILTGKNRPSLDTLEAIAARYPNTATWLLTGKGEPLAKSETEAPAAAPAQPLPVVPRFGQETELAIARAMLSDRDKTIEAKDAKIAELNQKLGKPSDSSDAADPSPFSNPEGPAPQPMLRGRVKGLRRYQD